MAVGLEKFSVCRGGCEGQKKPSNFSSNFVTHGSALLGIVAASTKREALNLAACRDARPHGVLGVYLSLDLAFRVRQPV